MSLSDIVNVSITAGSVQVGRAGFGTPLIVSHSATWVERVRTYSKLSEVLVDFGATTPEYLAAAAIFSQNPRPTQIKIGRSANKPTQQWKISVVSVANSTDYKVIKSDGTVVTYTSDASATNDEIAAGIAAALTIAGFTVATAGSALSLYVTVTASTAGNYCSISVDDVTLLKLEQVHADPSLATNLAAIAVEDNDWFALITLFNSELSVAAAAAWAETNHKLYVVASADTPIITVAAGGATDIAKDEMTAAHAMVHVLYHPRAHEFLDAALVGKMLPKDPGSATWIYKNLSGPTPAILTSTHRTNLAAKNAGYYEALAGVNSSFGGKVAEGEWLDVVVGSEWFKTRLQERIASRLLSADKIPFTNPGIAVVESEIRAQIADGIKVGFLADSPEATVVVPDVADVSAADKALRSLTGVEFQAPLAGAIHAATITGTVI